MSTMGDLYSPPESGDFAVRFESSNGADFAEVLVATTWECNLRCTYCFVDERELNTAGNRMTPALAARVVDALDQAFDDVETVCIHLYGGEPLTNLPAIRSMVRRAADKPTGRFIFAVTTNGTRTAPEVFEVLDAGRFFVILSVDGPAAVHDECRRSRGGRPTHATVMEFLEGLRTQTRCAIQGSAVVRSGWSLPEAEQYLRSLGVDSIKAQAVRVPAGARIGLSAEEHRQYLSHLEDVGRSVIDDLDAGRRPLDDRFSSRVFQLMTGTLRTHYCGAGTRNFGITPSGEVLGCILLGPEHDRLGHICDDPISWRRAGKAWVDRHEPGATCRECAALPLCGGGCPAISPVCGERECEIVKKSCEVAHEIHEHFKDRPEALLGLAGIF